MHSRIWTFPREAEGRLTVAEVHSKTGDHIAEGGAILTVKDAAGLLFELKARREGILQVVPVPGEDWDRRIPNFVFGCPPPPPHDPACHYVKAPAFQGVLLALDGEPAAGSVLREGSEILTIRRQGSEEAYRVDMPVNGRIVWRRAAHEVVRSGELVAVIDPRSIAQNDPPKERRLGSPGADYPMKVIAVAAKAGQSCKAGEDLLQLMSATGQVVRLRSPSDCTISSIAVGVDEILHEKSHLLTIAEPGARAALEETRVSGNQSPVAFVRVEAAQEAPEAAPTKEAAATSREERPAQNAAFAAMQPDRPADPAPAPEKASETETAEARSAQQAPATETRRPDPFAAMQPDRGPEQPPAETPAAASGAEPRSKPELAPVSEPVSKPEPAQPSRPDPFAAMQPDRKPASATATQTPPRPGPFDAMQPDRPQRPVPDKATAPESAPRQETAPPTSAPVSAPVSVSGTQAAKPAVQGTVRRGAQTAGKSPSSRPAAKASSPGWSAATGTYGSRPAPPAGKPAKQRRSQEDRSDAVALYTGLGTAAFVALYGLAMDEGIGFSLGAGAALGVSGWFLAGVLAKTPRLSFLLAAAPTLAFVVMFTEEINEMLRNVSSDLMAIVNPSSVERAPPVILRNGSAPPPVKRVERVTPPEVPESMTSRTPIQLVDLDGLDTGRTPELVQSQQNAFERYLRSGQ